MVRVVKGNAVSVESDPDEVAQLLPLEVVLESQVSFYSILGIRVLRADIRTTQLGNAICWRASVQRAGLEARVTQDVVLVLPAFSTSAQCRLADSHMRLADSNVRH